MCVCVRECVCECVYVCVYAAGHVSRSSHVLMMSIESVNFECVFVCVCSRARY